MPELREIEKEINLIDGISVEKLSWKFPEIWASLVCKIDDAVFAEADAETLELWQDVYDFAYDKVDFEEKRFDTEIWTDPYTQKAIPEDMMNDWVNETVRRVKSLQPRNVLEIGCGTGLIMFAIVNSVNWYIGTDFSLTIIDKLKKYCDDRDIANVVFFKGDACSKPNMKYGVDTVIMNSVSQYFPSIHYMTDTLRAVSSIVGKGKVYIGDIRNYDILEQFRYAQDIGLEEDMQTLTTRRDEANELLISPDYFILLQRKIPEIVGIEILPKNGFDELMMNKYRYDVILSIDTSQRKEKEGRFYDKCNEFLYSYGLELKRLLGEEANSNGLIVRNYPNFRLLKDKGTTLNMESLELLAKEMGFSLYICFALDEEKRSCCFDLYFYKEKIKNFSNIYDKSKVKDKNVCNFPTTKEFIDKKKEEIENLFKKHHICFECYFR